MTQRFFHTLTHFVVIFTTLFLVFGPLMSNLAQAQLTPDTYADLEPPTEGYESIFDTTGGDDLLFSMPVGDITEPSEDSAEFFDEVGEGTATTETESGNSINVVQAINLSNSKNFEMIYNFLVMAGGWVASLGGMLFDFAFERLVLEFGCWFVADAGAAGCTHSAGQVGGAVNQLWTVVRDLFNLIFIFSLVYIGLRLIVDANETATQKTVGLLIAAALLVNFSLYIGKLVIDVSNFTAVQIHDAMVGGFTYVGDGYSVTDEVETDEGTEVVTLIGSTGQESISGAFMQILYISTFFSSNSLVSDGPGALLVGVIAFIFLCYLGFVLAYGAVMVVVRFIALVFLLIFSPAMFLGWVLPQFDKYSRQWRTNFISYSFFIPAYVFLLYTSLFVLIQISEALKTDAGGYGAVFNDGATADTWSIFLLYILGVGFLYASTKVAGAMAKSGAVVGMSAASKAAALPLAWGYRNTVGRGAGRLMKGMDAIDRRLARAEDSSNKMSKLNPLRYGTKAALSLGREVAGGKTTRGTVETVRNYGVAGNRGIKQVEDDLKEQNTRTASGQSTADLKKKVGAGKDAPDGSNERLNLERAIASASGSQIENLGSKTLSNKIVAGAMSQSQFESVIKSDKFNDSEKAAISTARKNYVEEKLKHNNRVEVEKATTNQLLSLGSEYLSDENVAINLSPSQLDDIKKKMTETEYGTIAKANEKALLDLLNGNNPVQAFNKPNGDPKKDKDIAKMPAKVLTHTNSQYYMNANILKGILDNETLTANQRSDLKTNITSQGTWGQYSPADQQKFTNFFNSPYGNNF